MKKRQKRQWGLSILYMLLALAAAYVLQSLFTAPRPRQVSYSDFLQELRAGRLEEVHITTGSVVGKLKQGPERNRTVSAARVPGLDTEVLTRELAERGVKFSGEMRSAAWWMGILAWLVPLTLLFLFYFYSVRRMTQGSGALKVGRNRAKIYDQATRINVTFADVAGVEEAKAELVEVVDFLRTPQKYQRLGGRIPRGVLLVGAPGTGKTLLARAVAGEAGVPFFSISGSEFVEMFVGVGASRVRDLFDQAKLKAPCIVFIDELDAVGKSRATGRAALFGHAEREQTLNQLLVEMDGFDPSRGVIIMAATNTPEVLDPALMRPGRFDRQVIVDRPDMRGREAILRVHARKVKLSPDVNLAEIASATPGMVGADLANIVNEAALLAARRGADAVCLRDLQEAVDRVMLGLEQKSRVMSADEKRRVACHEAGHALVALSLPHADPVHRVSIIPRSIGALGHTMQLPTQEKYLLTTPELRDRLTVMLGGRAAEEIVYAGVISTGAANDLERASELARQMVTRFGMSEALGNVAYGRPDGSKFLGLPGEERNYSERTAERIDGEVRRLMEELYARARETVTRRRGDLDRVTGALMEKETLDRAELEGALAPVAV